MKTKALVWTVLTLSTIAHAQTVTKVGTTAAPFLSIGVGARAIGMGGSFVSVANDASAMYWNPAGITRLKGYEATFTHSEWIADISFDYAGAVLSLGRVGSVGVNGTFLTMSDFERTTERDPEGTGEFFNAGSYALGVSYARDLTDRFSIGFNAKYINEHILNSSAKGFAIDVGTLYTTRFKDLTVGMSITNFGTKMRMSGRDLLIQHDLDPTRKGNNENINADLKTDRFDLPLLFRVGVSMDVLKAFEVENNSLLVSVDAVHPNDNVESVNVGGEYVWNRTVAVRAGYRALGSRDSEQGFTVGGGLHARVAGSATLKVDYAYEDFGRFDNIQKFSLAIGF